MAKNTPPPIQIPGNLGTAGTGYKKGSKKVSPTSLNLDMGNLSHVRIPGSLDFFGITTLMGQYTSPIGMQAKNGMLNAATTLDAFTQMTPEQRAQVQYKLYLAGYYPTNYQPTIGGVLREEDIAAFRSFLIGVAANPSGGTIGQMLDGAAQQGQANGVQRTQRDPLTITLSNPDDIKAVIQSGASGIFGKYLDPQQVDQFVNAYRDQQAQYQTAQYRATGFDPATGLEITSPSGQRATQQVTVTQPANEAGMQREFFNQMAAVHPDETRVAVFQDKLDEILNALKGPQ